MCEDAPCCGCCGREPYYPEETLDERDFDERDFDEHDQDAWDDDGQPDDLTEQAEFEGADEYYGVREDYGDYWGD